MEIRQHGSDIHALGMAVNLLRRSEPFSNYAFGPLAGNLMGQIKRKHYLFTVEGRQVLGYAGWALCAPEIAEAWLEGRYMPAFEECENGSCWVGLTWYSATRAACLFQARHLRQRFPDQVGRWRRDYGDRRRQVKVRNIAAGATPLSPPGDFAEPG